MKYAETHEWVKIEDDQATVGISNNAQEQLSDVVYVDLPSVGDIVERGESFMSIESVKAASAIYAPVSGEIIEVNEDLDGKPDLVNESPEEKGWLIKIKLTDPSEYDDLMEKEDYLSSID